MKNRIVLVSLMVVMSLLLACGSGPELPPEPPPPPPELPPPPTIETPSGEHLTPNPVEESMPIYGGTLHRGYWVPRTFDGHQKAGYGPSAQLLVFNQLVMFSLDYKECVPETIVGDLAESWEWSEDGKTVTFNLRQGINWHDGVPFTANDVIYSLDKMNDVNRSAIASWFPAYESTEKINDYTVKVHLEYASASFMTALAQGECQIQALHLAGTDNQIADFMIGTGPFILEDFLTQVHLKFKRNPDYWKYDQYGNQMPYLDEVYYHHTPWKNVTQMVIGRRLDFPGTMLGAGNTDTYNTYKEGAPELLWQKRERYNGTSIFLNLNKEPLNDIRVRRAIGLLIVEEDLIAGATGDVMFGLPGAGILYPAFGLPEEEIAELMGWNKPWDERVAEAQQLMVDAGYPDGFKMHILATAARGVDQILADVLRVHLKIEAEIGVGLGTIEVYQRIDENWQHSYSHTLDVMDPVQLATYFGTDGFYNYSNYSNPELDELLVDMDRIIDPDERREAVWAIERILLTDLPVLPTGHFPINYMPYYPHIKNLRWNYISYSNNNRLEDVWIDESLRVK